MRKSVEQFLTSLTGDEKRWKKWRAAAKKDKGSTLLADIMLAGISHMRATLGDGAKKKQRK